MVPGRGKLIESAPRISGSATGPESEPKLRDVPAAFLVYNAKIVFLIPIPQGFFGKFRGNDFDLSFED